MTSESIGPYRVLSRRLDGDVERCVAEAPGGPRVVLRRRGSGTTPPRPVTEAVAFARADHPHVATLVDVLTSPPGELVLAFEDLGGEPLASWLAARGRPEPGEVVTLVVPVLGAIQHLARRGVAISTLAVEDVEIDARGAPVVVGLSSAAAVPDAEHASLPVAAGFARAMVERAAGPARQVPLPPLDTSSFDSLVESVFDLGEAVPLSSVDPTDGGVDESLGDLRDSCPADEPVVPGWLAFLPECEALDRVVARLPDLGPRQVLTGLGAVRARYRLLAAGIVVVVGATVALWPSSMTRDDGEADKVASAVEGAVEPSGTVRASPGAATAPPRPSGSTSTADEIEAAVTGEDAGVAVEVLLTSRRECLRDATPSCLRAVDQPGSPIALRDAAVLDDPSRVADAAIVLELTGPSTRSGGSVLFDARGPDGEPASVLVMRTEAGWRLRDVFVGS
ncbi:hypothetical protein [Frigoribacterium sp. VKM Ac-2836]|uniref:hypothetical protein n=1 Tax=Frigoribacterium sp. VKM Ac-2836 TaxID=2739014 RepID=UPI001563C999|nr:hypothetical protein [Frigoribacterium sp. VKM Ac-2836]NRD25895.1 hypothetical protein [Frigoribacterium sp. VKM Ac-2836]